MKKNIIFSALVGVLASLTVITAQAKNISQNELMQQIASESKPVVIDVRSAGEFDAGHVPGAINISHKELKSRLSELAGLQDKQIVLYCRSGTRAGIAKDILVKNGFKQLDHLEGDYNGWTDKKLPIEKGSKAGKSVKKVTNPCGL